MTLARRRRPAHDRRRPVGVAAATLVAAAGLTGCLGDPAPDPSTAPLELVLESCALNRPGVVAGGHTMAVVGQGRVTVSDPDGQVVLTARGGEPAPATLQLQPGRYAVTCEPEGGRLGETVLEVDAPG